MGYSTGIEWTNHTFNPWWGCTKVSPGCDFCYAETMASRFGNDVWGDGKPRRTLSDAYWREPLKWNAEAERALRRSRVFCASMADVFDAGAPEGQLDRLWLLIKATPWLDWQLLTKRPGRIAASLPKDWGQFGYPNVWLGTSVEDSSVLHRVRQLTANSAIVHFLSVEPLIGPIPALPLEDIEWAIVGGESGHTPRPMEEEWVLDIQKQCAANRTAFFFKQWGGTNKKAKGRLLGGRTYDQIPLTVRHVQEVPPQEGITFPVVDKKSVVLATG